MAAPSIDHVTTEFEYPVLTKIHDMPMYKAPENKNETKGQWSQCFL